MNTFYEHHQDNIKLSYRCFDRILLNGLIQPFQQPERVIGFFNAYRSGQRVSRQLLRDIAEQFHNWVKNRAQKWGAPIVDPPAARRDEFVAPYFKHAKTDQVVLITVSAPSNDEAVLRAKAVAAVNFNSTVQMHSCRACGHPP